MGDAITYLTHTRVAMFRAATTIAHRLPLNMFQSMFTNPSTPYRAAIVAIGATMAMLFASVLGRYWVFYHLDAPFDGVALLYIISPITFVVSSGLGLFLFHRLAKRRGPGIALAIAAAAMAILFVALFVLELVQTSGTRAADGTGAGRLKPFFRSLL